MELCLSCSYPSIYDNVILIFYQKEPLTIEMLDDTMAAILYQVSGEKGVNQKHW